MDDGNGSACCDLEYCALVERAATSGCSIEGSVQALDQTSGWVSKGAERPQLLIRVCVRGDADQRSDDCGKSGNCVVMLPWTNGSAIPGRGAGEDPGDHESAPCFARFTESVSDYSEVIQSVTDS
jgi:hypothetical protein